MQTRLTNTIRVFLLEDHLGGLEALAHLLERTPEGDLVYAGGLARNEPDLPQKINELQVDVALVDLVLSPGITVDSAKKSQENWGIRAVESIRYHCKPDIKIIAYSNWSQLRSEALEAGADAFLSKEATADELRQMIRHVMGQDVSPPDDPYNLGRIRKLEIFPDKQAIIVHGTCSTENIMLPAPSFALLYYLSLERIHGEQFWLERIDEIQENIPVYRVKKTDIWRNIAERYSIGANLRDEFIDTSIIAQWATKLNAALRLWHEEGRAIALIRVPGRRKARGERSNYMLTPSISGQNVTIHETN